MEAGPGSRPDPWQSCPFAALSAKLFTFSCGLALRMVLPLAALFIFALIGCGGGGTSGTSGQSSQSYALSVSTASLSISPGGTANLIVTGDALNGFSGTISVSFGGLPAGVTVSPPTFTFTGSGTQQVQFSAASTLAAGNSTIILNCSGATPSPSAQFQLTVTGPPAFSLSLQPASLSLIPGVQQQAQLSVNPINGFNQLVSGTVIGLPSGVTVSSSTFSLFPGDIATIYFTAAAGASSGTITFNASSGSLSASAQLPISINTTPDFQLTTGTNNVLVISQSASASFNISAVSYNGFSQPVSISFSGAPAGVTFSPPSFTLNPGGASQTATVIISSSAAPSTNTGFLITGSAAGITHQLQFSLNILAAALTLSVQPANLTVASGSTNSFELGLLNSTIGTPMGSISLRITGVPSGVTVSPLSYTSPPQGVEFNVYVTAGTGATSGTLSITATFGQAEATASMPIVIGAADQFTQVSLSTADRLLRADTSTPYYGFPPPNYTVYHAATQRFFSTEPYLSHLNVVDATSRKLIATLTIPGAFGLDQAPDGSVLYVGTMLGDLYLVDPAHLTIVQRYASSAISQYGFPANAVYALADGKLILESYFLVPGYSWVDGNGPIALWDPATNDITVFGQDNLTGYGYSGSAPTVPSCFNRVENVMLTNNRTRVLLAPVISSEGSSELCSLDPETDTWNLSGQISGGSGSALATLAVASDGNTLFAFDGYNVYDLDPATFAVNSSFPVAAPKTPGYAPIPVLLVSADNNSVFLTDPNGADVFDQYNVAAGQLSGWISQLNMASPASYTPVQSIYQAITPAGLAAGVIPGGGIGLLDTNAVHPLPIGSRFTQTQLAIPYGPLAGGTDTSWLPNLIGVSPPPLGSIYFGPNAAADINNNGFPGLLEALTPPGTAGPVDVRAFPTDGSSQLIPDGFSYGPWVLEAPTNYSTADGGGTGDLFGYGFGPQLYTGGAFFITPPADLAVTIGGASAAVNEFSPNPYGSTYFTAPVFPSNLLQYTIPPGTAGTSANINVSNASGSTTATQPMSFLPALQRYPVSGQLADGIYDSTRDVYYFSDANQIRIFSLTQNAWLPSIPIPAPHDAYGPQRLAGLAMSPNGASLAVADAGAIAAYVVQLNNSNSITSYPFASQFPPLTEVPTALAITNSGIVYVATSDLNGDGGCGFLLALNPSTGTFSNVGPPSQGNCLPTEGGTVGTSLASSPDGSRIFFDDSGILGYIDTASGQVSTAPIGDTNLGQGGYEIEVSASQARLFADGFLTDTDLNPIGLQVLNVAESADAQYVYGGVFSADGSLFFQPGTEAIDVFDAVTGAFRTRVALPLPLSPNFRALVSNTNDNRIIAITGNAGDGIAVIDLSSLPEPPPVTWLSAVAAPAVTRNPQASNTSSQKKLESSFPMIHRPASPLLRGLAKPRQ
jgi:hypothetical protein